MTTEETNAIQIAVDRLEALTDPENQACAVPAEHKKAVRIYVQTWIIPQLRAAATPPAKRTHDQRWLLKNGRRTFT